MFEFVEVKKRPVSRRVLKQCAQCGKAKELQKSRKICQACRDFNHTITSGQVRTPDITDVNVANYKEPMEKVKDGFGYYGAITETNDGKHIQCHICGFYYGNVGVHLRVKHKIAPRDYKIKYGLRIKEGLLSPVKRWEAQVRYNKYTRKSPEEMRELSRKAVAAKREKGVKSGGDQWTAQTRNETGTCKEQTLAKIRHIAELSGGIPTWRAYVSEYGGMDVVRHWFGNWANAVKEAGVTSFLENRAEERKIRMASVEEMIRAFYEEEHRTPKSSDFNAVEYLPGLRQVQTLYGTLNNARVAAGVPTIVYLSHTRKWVEVEPGVETDGFVPSSGRLVEV